MDVRFLPHMRRWRSETQVIIEAEPCLAPALEREVIPLGYVGGEVSENTDSSADSCTNGRPFAPTRNASDARAGGGGRRGDNNVPALCRRHGAGRALGIYVFIYAEIRERGLHGKRLAIGQGDASEAEPDHRVGFCVLVTLARG